MFLYYFYFTFAFAGLGIVAFCRQWPINNSMIVVYYILRLLAVAYLFFVMECPAFDISGWYEHSHRMISGEIAGRDFMSPYGLLFNMLLWFSVYIWDNPFSIVVMFSLMEAMGIFILKSALNRFCKRKLSNAILWLFITSPFVVKSLGWNMQDEGLLLAVMSGLFYLYVAKKDKFMPIVAIFGIALTKALAIIYIAPFFIAIHLKHSVRFIIGVIIYFLMLYLIGINPFCIKFERLNGHIDNITQQITPGNPWYLMKNFVGDDIHLIAQMSYLLVLVFVILSFFMLAKKRYDESITEAFLATIASIGLVSVSINKMSYVFYLVPVLPFLFLSVVKKFYANSKLRALVGCGLFFWYIVTSPSILRKIFGQDLSRTVDSFLFPLSAFVIFIVVTKGVFVFKDGWYQTMRKQIIERFVKFDKEFDDESNV